MKRIAGNFHRGILGISTTARTITALGIAEVVTSLLSAFSQTTEPGHAWVVHIVFYECFVNREWCVFHRIE